MLDDSSTFFVHQQSTFRSSAVLKRCPQFPPLLCLSPAADDCDRSDPFPYENAHRLLQRWMQTVWERRFCSPWGGINELALKEVVTANQPLPVLLRRPNTTACKNWCRNIPCAQNNWGHALSFSLKAFFFKHKLQAPFGFWPMRNGAEKGKFKAFVLKHPSPKRIEIRLRRLNLQIQRQGWFLTKSHP